MTPFTLHTVETAPEKSKEILKNIKGKVGFVPNVIAEMAESPALLKGYHELMGATAMGTLSPTELQVVQMTVSSLNNCSYCIAAHTTLAEKGGVSREVLENLRKEQPLKDPKLEALRTFTVKMLKKMGWADKQDLEAFYKAGYTKAHVMEIILSISLKMITNYTNHIASTPLDKPFEVNKIEEKRQAGKSTHAA